MYTIATLLFTFAFTLLFIYANDLECLLSLANIDYYHKLRCSASPVLTATGFVNGKGQFSTPHRTDTLNRSPKYLSPVITSTTPAKLGAYPSMGSFWAHGWNITKIIVIYSPFLRNSPTGHTRRQIFTHDGSNDADSRKDVPLLEIFHIAPNVGGQNPQNPQFWVVNRRFQAKLAKSKNVHIFKTTTSIPTKFCTVIKTTKWPSWVVPTHALQIQDGGRPPSWKKSKNCYILAAVQPILTKFGTMMQFDPPDRPDR